MDFIFDSSLVFYLPLHQLDGASFMSKDAYGHLATVTGAIWGLAGRTFDGVDDNIAVGSASGILDITGNQLTIMAWEKDEKIVSKGWMVGKMGSAAGSWGLLVNAPSGLRRIELGLDVGAGWGTSLSSDYFVPADTFNFLAATYDGAKVKFYANGVKDTTEVDKTGNIVSRPNTVKVGWEDGWNSDHFKGVLGEILVFTRALSPIEILNIYLATKWRYR